MTNLKQIYECGLLYYEKNNYKMANIFFETIINADSNDIAQKLTKDEYIRALKCHARGAYKLKEYGDAVANWQQLETLNYRLNENDLLEKAKALYHTEVDENILAAYNIAKPISESSSPNKLLFSYILAKTFFYLENYQMATHICNSIILNGSSDLRYVRLFYKTLLCRAETDVALAARSGFEDKKYFLQNALIYYQLILKNFANFIKPSVSEEMMTVENDFKDLIFNHCLVKIHETDIDFSQSRKLGEGSFGEVKTGVWNNTQVAVKTIKNSASTSNMADLENEVKLQALLSHENIVKLYAACMEAGKCCMVMELMVGGNLDKLILSGQPIAWSVYLKLAADIANGLKFMHENHIIHRDIKPENILLNSSSPPTAKIADLGLSISTFEASTISGTAGIVGSPRWTAPEVWKFGTSECSSDIYSFGLTLWGMASRTRPWKHAKSLSDIKDKVVRGLRPWVPAGTPSDFAALIRLCWICEPKARPDANTILLNLNSQQSSTLSA